MQLNWKLLKVYTWDKPEFRPEPFLTMITFFKNNLYLNMDILTLQIKGSVLVM